MKNNLINTLSFHLKGYDRVRAIYKIRQNINKFGDKLGKKNRILNHIIKRNITSNKFIDLRINKFYPKSSTISFSNDLIKRQHNKYSQILKDDDNEEELTLDKQNAKIIFKNILKNENEKRKSDSKNNLIEDKIKKEKNIIKNNKIIDDESFKQEQENNKKKFILMNNYQLFKPIKNNKTSIDFLSVTHSDKISHNISPKNFNNNDIINLIKDKDKEDNSKKIMTKSTSNLNMSLFTKKIIPKIHVLQLKGSSSLIKLTKNAVSEYKNKNKITIKSRNEFRKKHKISAKTELKKHLSYYPNNNNNESNEKQNDSNRAQSMIEPINKNLVSRGFNTSITQYYKYLNRKSIPSYIKLPNINRISIPNILINKGLSNHSPNTDLNKNYYLLKDNENQFINKIYPMKSSLK